MSTSPKQFDDKKPQPQSAERKFHEGWRQVRLFTRDVNRPNWYAQLLGTAIKPVIQHTPDAVFFVSRYVCRLKEDDDADTDISKIPQDFLFATPDKKQIHFSVRFRFRPGSSEEKHLKTAMKGMPEFWFSDFLAFDMPAGLAGDRFSTAQDKDSQERRARFVAELLCANSRLIVDSLVYKNGEWNFEQNNHKFNQLLGSVVQSALHMVVNPWSGNDSNSFPIYVRFNDTFFTRL